MYFLQLNMHFPSFVCVCVSVGAGGWVDGHVNTCVNLHMNVCVSLCMHIHNREHYRLMSAVFLNRFPPYFLGRSH